MLRTKQPWRRHMCTEPAMVSPSALSSWPTPPPTGLEVTWCDRRGSISAWCLGERRSLSGLVLFCVPQGHYCCLNAINSRRHCFLSALFHIFWTWFVCSVLLAQSTLFIPQGEIKGNRVCTKTYKQFMRLKYLTSVHLTSVLFCRCIFVEQSPSTLTSLTNILHFLWLLHNKNHPVFHQMNAFNVKQQQYEMWG